MTSYNREKFIGFAIESVQRSTYTNFELVIVDDGSRDSTVDIARSYAEKDHRIKVFINKSNLGDYPNRNRAAQLATGKYLKYVDADDAIYPWGLEILVSCMEQFPDAGWGLCSLDNNADRLFPFSLTSDEAFRYHYLGKGLFHKAPLSSIIRKDIFFEVDGFDHIRMAGDFNMWHKLAKVSPVVLMPHGIAWYRRHDSQEMTEYRKYVLVYDEITVRHLNGPDCPLHKSEIEKIRKKLIRTCEKSMLRNIAKAKISSFKLNKQRV